MTKKNSQKTYLIGTRGSLLALTQATQTKIELEEKTGLKFELKIITTQGDQVTDKALWQLEGKDFFTKELDLALLNKEIDLVIHSYKDLGSIRPSKIHLAAITKRQFSQDILLIKKTTIEKFKNKESDFIVGTSAPRRITNIEDSLASFLPFKNINVKCETLRGNVNSRIQKLQDDKYDAIILAHAGIERLALSSESAKELKKLLQGLTFKVLPLSHFPPAASQGSLAIETHEDNKELIEAIKSVHHVESAECIKREREVFQSYGGGCHLAVGIHVTKCNDLFLKYEKGQVDHKKISSQKILNSSLEKVSERNLFLGFPKKERLLQDYPHLLFDELTEKISLTEKENTSSNLFVTSSYCFEKLKSVYNEQYLWAAGYHTHQKLSTKGYWVCADSDSLGIEKIHEFLSSQSLEILLNTTDLAILTEENSTYPHYPVLKAYKRSFKEADSSYLEELSKRDHFYWGSFPQYLHFTTLVPDIKNNPKNKHYCGLGKTYFKLKQESVNLTPLLNFKELLI